MLRLFLTSVINRYRQSEAIPILTALGVVIGIFVGLISILFKLILTSDFLLLSNPANFSPLERFFLPVAGSVILSLVWSLFPVKARAVGVAHVINAAINRGGKLPFINVIAQALGSLITLLSGHPLGREGPAVHIGAGIASQIGQYLRLNTQKIQILLGCGAAAAIAALFNTPFAGVIFALEVILIHYTLANAIPLIAAAATAALVSQIIFPGEIFLFQANAIVPNFTESVGFGIMGAAVGTIAALMNLLIRTGLRARRTSHYFRFIGAGLATGTIAVFVPLVLGSGYQLVTPDINAQIPLALLISVFTARFLLTSLSVGFGMPAGIIGPSLVLGALFGALWVQLELPFNLSNPDNAELYIIIAAAAMMSAILQAPLAALVTVLELSGNTSLLFPVMATLIASSLTCRFLFKQPSIFINILQAQGFSLLSSPLESAFNRISAVEHAMPADIQIPVKISHQELKQLAKNHSYIIIQSDQSYYLLEKEQINKILTEEPTGSSPINLLPWLSETNQLLWLATNVTLDQVIRQLTGRVVAGVRFSANEGDNPSHYLPKNYLLDLLTKLGD